ncbi:MAG: hypothetical protein H3Z53_04740 [archaeon]|nr:hypothetical protein [archaeon]MCP8313665.1 hypothetical protein [archaeon]
MNRKAQKEIKWKRLRRLLEKIDESQITIQDAMSILENRVSKRMTEHYLEELKALGLIEYDPERRVYLTGSQKSVVAEYLLRRFWRQEEEIEKDLLSPLHWTRAFENANFLYEALPSPYKEKAYACFNAYKEPRELADSKRLANGLRYQTWAFTKHMLQCIVAILHEMERRSI